MMTKKNAPDRSSPSSPENGSVYVGDDTIDTVYSLETPRRPKSDTHIAAFDKAEAKRAAKSAAAAPAAMPTPPAPAATLLAPAADRPEPTAPPKRKIRLDKGGKEG